MRKIIGLILVAILGCASMTQAADLNVGDKAPKLASGKFVQGEPVKEFEKGKVYVIECWATWCGPCVAAIPHVNDLQKKYAEKGLIVIGQNVWEREEEKVEPFIKKMGDKMSYRVALDDKAEAKDGKMAETWMRASGQSGIPCSFIVNQEGVIAWIGHPMEMDEPLEQIIAGKFDIEKAKKAAGNKAVIEQAGQELFQAMQDKKWDVVEKKLDEIAKLDENAAKQMAPLRIITAHESGNKEKAGELAEKLMKDDKVPAGALAWVSMQLIESKTKDLPLTEKLATTAVDKAKGEEPFSLMVLAKVHAEKGDFAKAAEVQKKAVDKAPEPIKGQLEGDLKRYEEKAKPATQPAK